MAKKPVKPLKKSDKPQLRLLGKNGNAFAIMGAAQRVAKANDMDWETIRQEAQSGDYDNLLRVMMKYFEVV